MKPLETEPPTPDDAEDPGPDAGMRVSALELFSDLVFVFAITQLTTVLVNHRTWVGLGHVLLIFGMVWWMYGGYIWLTNAVRPDRPVRRVLLLGAMAGFLVMGLATPRAFEGDGVVFGFGYLVVVVIHAGLFSQAASATSFGPIIRVAPFNLASALLLIVAGALGGVAQEVLWTVALAIQVLSPFITGTSGFRIEPGHFVERYGLLVLIALGESIVAVGAGGGRYPLNAGVVETAVLGLALTAALWWTYFVGDEERAEAALRATPIPRRPVRALVAFFYAQIPMLLGIVAIAATVKSALPHPAAAATVSQAWLLASGAAAFLTGDVLFRASLGITRGIWRAMAAPLALATAAVGVASSIVVQLAVLSAVLIAALVVESRSARAPHQI
jgi:low temperature requirement protein LtrA